MGPPLFCVLFTPTRMENMLSCASRTPAHACTKRTLSWHYSFFFSTKKKIFLYEKRAFFLRKKAFFKKKTFLSTKIVRALPKTTILSAQ